MTNSIEQPPLNTSQMGMVMAAANHFGLNVDIDQAFFESGHGFMVNVRADVCPSGPYVWNNDRFRSQLQNFGLRALSLGFVYPDAPESERVEMEKKVAKELDAGKVVGIGHFDYQVVLDLNSEGFVLTQPWGPDAPVTPGALTRKTWKELENPPPVEFISFSKCDALDPESRLSSALSYAKDVFEDPEGFQHPEYGTSLNAYPLWQEAMQNEEHDRHGQWWNATVWSECRNLTGQYMRRIKVSNSTLQEDLNQLGSRYIELAETICASAPQDLALQEKLELITAAEQIEKDCAVRIRALPLGT